MICDLAETYHILNYRELLPELVATLVLGLRDDSRVKMHYSKSKITLNQTLEAIIADNMQFLAWTKTKEAKKGRYKKKSILKLLNGVYDNSELASFETIEEYEKYMKQFDEE